MADYAALIRPTGYGLNYRLAASGRSARGARENLVHWNRNSPVLSERTRSPAPLAPGSSLCRPEYGRCRRIEHARCILDQGPLRGIDGADERAAIRELHLEGRLAGYRDLAVAGEPAANKRS